MPIDDKTDLFDRTCPTCDHDGMNKTQAPAPGGPTAAFSCPACGAIDRDDDTKYVQKR